MESCDTKMAWRTMRAATHTQPASSAATTRRAGATLGWIAAMSAEVSHPPARAGRRVPAILTLVLALAAFVAAIVFRTQTHEAPLRDLLVVGGSGALVAAVSGAVRRAWGVALTVVVLVVVLVAGTGAWIGANSPELTWFGALVSHGDRHVREVA